MKNMRARNTVTSNLLYSISSNVLSFAISTIVVLIVPKLIGVEHYGLWQLYLFYTSYSGFLLFGWNDGMYLRLGGQKYEDLDKKSLSSQFYMNTIMQATFGLSIVSYSFIFISDSERLYVLVMTAVSMFLTNIRVIPLFIQQATDRINQFAIVTIVDRVVYLATLSVLIIAGYRNYRLMILADIIGKAVSLGLISYFCRDIIFRYFHEFSFEFAEAYANIIAGIKLMLSNIASQLIVGTTKFGIERAWDISTFSKVSLTLSISNLLMLFISAVSLVVYPTLRRVSEVKLPQIYIMLRDFMMPILLALLLLYYPLNVFVSIWLPQYSDSLKYMAILFPFFIFQGKMSLLISTYLKAMRKEKALLIINSITMLISFFVSVLTTHILHSLDLAIVAIIVLLAIRSIIAEFFVAKLLVITVFADVLIETALVTVFILASWFMQSWHSTITYMIFYMVYWFYKKNAFYAATTNLRNKNRQIIIDNK